MEGPFRENQEPLEEISALKQTIRELQQSNAERLRVEEALQENEALLKTYLENAPDGIYMNDMEGNFLYGNRKAEEIIGYNRDELTGKNLLDANLLPEQSLRKAAELFQASIEGKSTGPDELELINKEGRLIPVEISTSVIQYVDQRIVLGFVRDITERKLAEEAVRESEEKYRSLISYIPGVVYRCANDPDWTMSFISEDIGPLSGYQASDLVNNAVRSYASIIHPEDRELVARAVHEGVEKKRAYDMEYRINRVDGCIAWVHERGHGVFDLEGNLLCIEGIILDITERKRSEEEKRNLESQLRRAQKMESIGTLAGGIAHDFNNILTALMGYVSLIQMKMDKDSPLRRYVDQVLSASRKAADLTRGLLAFSRQQPVALVPLDVNDTIETTKKLLKRLLTEDIELRTSLTKDDAVVMADRSQMDQILFNLVSNARDAMPKGGTLIIETNTVSMDSRFVRIHGFGEPGRYVLISISDTGEGMDEATREKAFDPFFTTKKTGKGTGLGLATVYGIVKQHRGFITVYSEPNQGTTFRIYLPAVSTRVDQKQRVADPVNVGNETILVAEDDEVVRHVLRELFQEYGYRVIEAVDGEDAINTFKQPERIDLVILDSVMPKKNGHEAYKEIRRNDPDIKVLFTSGYTKDIVLAKGIEDNEFDFIAKPLLLDELLRKVREVLDRK